MTHRRRRRAATLLLLLRTALLLSNGRTRVESFSLPPPDTATRKVRVAGETAAEELDRKAGAESASSAAAAATVHRLTIPLETPRPRPAGLYANLVELWNDPRPVSSLVSTSDRSKVEGNEGGDDESVPYCIVSDEFTVEDESFLVLLYPRGRYGRSTASAYLRYLPGKPGDEVDIAWRLTLVSTSEERNSSTTREGDTTRRPLGVTTAGALPRSNTTWSAAMTFASELESVESTGRTADWGSTIWDADEVCSCLGRIEAELEMRVFARRSGESSFALPPGGALGSVARQARAGDEEGTRAFRSGEVVVPRDVDDATMEELKRSFVYPGIDYRVMTMTNGRGEQIFDTEEMDEQDRSSALVALRPCGWKLQSQLWERAGMKTDWPVEVNAGLLSKVVTTRFNANSAVPRVVGAFRRDFLAYTFALSVALLPIPATLLVRNAVSLYDIPSASMEPTLLKGDVLLVEKFPNAFGRSKRGDVVLFRPPRTLEDIVTGSGSRLSSTSLFVKRLAGLPGDTNIRLEDKIDGVGGGDVTIDGQRAAGPDRSLCADEPLGLIDRLLEDGRGVSIDELREGEAYVLGDCKAVSVDSRVFGVLPTENIVGRPIARVWPPGRVTFGDKF